MAKIYDFKRREEKEESEEQIIFLITKHEKENYCRKPGYLTCMITASSFKRALAMYEAFNCHKSL